MSDNKKESPAERAEYERDQQRFGDDPNAVDRMKIYPGLHEHKGKFYQQIGDEFFEVPESEIIKPKP